jgi:hypothetical protein
LLKDKLLALFSKEITYRQFRDPLGNFEVFYPANWKFDRDIAVVDGKYTICFEGGRSHFTIAVDAALLPDFDFKSYAKKELESPSSGIVADLVRGKFKGMPAFTREYCYEGGGKTFFGGGTMFFTGRSVFSLSWAAPEKEKKNAEKIIQHMLDSLVVRYGLTMTTNKK